jgi:hypothetical protein
MPPHLQLLAAYKKPRLLDFKTVSVTSALAPTPPPRAFQSGPFKPRRRHSGIPCLLVVGSGGRFNTSFSCGWERGKLVSRRILTNNLSLFTIEHDFELSRHPSDIARNVLFALSCTNRVELPLSSEQVLVPNPQIWGFCCEQMMVRYAHFLSPGLFYCSYAASSKVRLPQRTGRVTQSRVPNTARYRTLKSNLVIYIPNDEFRVPLCLY